MLDYLYKHQWLARLLAFSCGLIVNAFVLVVDNDIFTAYVVGSTSGALVMITLVWRLD